MLKMKIQAALSLTEKKFEFIPLYSGGTLWINGFDSGVVLDINGLTDVPEKVPCCFDHEGESIVGEITPRKVMVDGKPQIYAEGHFLDTYAALKVLQEYKGRNTRWECSSGS